MGVLKWTHSGPLLGPSKLLCASRHVLLAIQGGVKVDMGIMVLTRSHQMIHSGRGPPKGGPILDPSGGTDPTRGLEMDPFWTHPETLRVTLFTSCDPVAIWCTLHPVTPMLRPFGCAGGVTRCSPGVTTSHSLLPTLKKGSKSGHFQGSKVGFWTLGSDSGPSFP